MMFQRCSLLSSSAAAIRRNYSSVLRAPSSAFSMTSGAKMATSTAGGPFLLAHQKQDTFGSPIQQHRLSSSLAQELQEALQSEIKAEVAMEEENLGGKHPPSIPGYKISKNGAEFLLTKMHGDEKILITVNVNHSVDIDEEEEDFSSEEKQDGMEHEPVPVSLPPFRVESTKGDQRLVFYLQMVKSEEGGYDFTVEEFMIAPAGKGEKYEEVPDEVYSSSGKYIDENLHQLLFVRFLEERGLSTQFCHDLVKFATHYEHQQYVQLLEKLKKFVGQN